MMDTNKQLVLAVDSNVAMRPYWTTIVSDYLHKIIRSICGNEAMVAASGNVELGLVVFNDHEYSCFDMSQRYGLTRDVDVLFDWLAFINFSSGTGGFNASIAEGLSLALQLFGSTNVSQNGHCILVVASNPDPPVYGQPNNIERQSEKCLSYAETVAKSFSESGVSLSVICPKHYPILKEIYNAGKRNPSAADHTIDTGENTQYLVLISENLMKDCADLSQSGIITVLQNPSAAQDSLNWKPVLVGINPPETVEGGRSLSMYTYNMISEGTRSSVHVSQTGSATSYVSGSSSIIISQPLHGNHELQQLVQSILATGTMTPPPPCIPLDQFQLNVKVWEGHLSCLKEGNPVFITRLQGYQILTFSNLLAEYWPPTMLIDRLISHDSINNKEIVEKADFLSLRSMDEHVLLRHLQQNNLCAVILLPSQVLVMVAIPDHQNELIGMLYPNLRCCVLHIIQLLYTGHSGVGTTNTRALAAAAVGTSFYILKPKLCKVYP